MSEYSSSLDGVLGYFCVHVDRSDGEAARAELAALHATIADQARQLEQAQAALMPFANIPCLENFDDDQSYDTIVLAGDVRAARLWIAENDSATAPQAQTAQHEWHHERGASWTQPAQRVAAEDEQMWDE